MLVDVVPLVVHSAAYRRGMLAVTDIPSEHEREVALALVPHQAQLRRMAGRAFGLLRNQSVDFIDLAAAGHGRAALVAMQEGVDSLLQATFSLVESSLIEQVLLRQEPNDPLLLGEKLPSGESNERVRWRLVRCGIEDAAIRTISGIDHLVNTHLRLAWETNATTEAEVRSCGFDATKPDPDTWASIATLGRGLEKLDADALLRAFRCTPPFETWLADESATAVREFRHAVIHRARPGHRETPAFGRSSLWSAGGKLSLTVNPFNAAPNASLPTLLERRTQIAAAISGALPYIDELWHTAVRWLQLVGVQVNHQPDAGTIRMTIGIGDPNVVPRAARDPGTFLGAPSTPSSNLRRDPKRSSP